VQTIRQRLFIFLFSLFIFLTFTSFITAFFSFSLTCSLYLHHISIYPTPLLKPDAVQLQVHAVNHRYSRGKQAEPGKLATPRTTSHGVTPANSMDVTPSCSSLVSSGSHCSVCARSVDNRWRIWRMACAWKLHDRVTAITCLSKARRRSSTTPSTLISSATGSSTSATHTDVMAELAIRS